MFGGHDSEKWTPALVRKFMGGRAGDGGVWSMRGGVIALGNGRRLADIVGVEEVLVSHSLVALQPSQTSPLAASEPVNNAPETHGAELISRTSLFYVEPGTRRRMRSFRFRPTTRARAVPPVLAPPSRLALALDAAGGLLLQRGPARVRLAQREQYPHLRVAWSYIGRQQSAKPKAVPTRPAVVETYDYNVDRRAASLSWSRVGRCPSWYGPGQCLTYLHGTRVRGGWRALDVAVKSWLAEVGLRAPLSIADLSDKA